MSRPREKRYQTYGSRWGEGKVHRYLYDSLNRIWYVACRRSDFGSYHGEVTDPNAEVTCKRCR